MPALRTKEDVDNDLHREHLIRRRAHAEMNSLTDRLTTLRRTYADAGRRIEALLDERNRVTSRCPDTPGDLDKKRGRRGL